VHSKFKKGELKKEEIKYCGLINNLEDIRIYELGKKEYRGYQDLQETGLKFIRDNIIIPEIESGNYKNDLLTFLGGCLQYRASGVDDSFFPEEIRKIADMIDEEWKVNWKPKEEGHEQSRIAAEKIIKKLRNFLNEEGKNNRTNEKEENEQEESEQEESEQGNQEKQGKQEKQEKQEEQGENEQEEQEENEENEQGEQEENEQGEQEENEQEQEENEQEQEENEQEQEENEQEQEGKQEIKNYGNNNEEENVKEEIKRMLAESEEADDDEESKSFLDKMEEIISEIIRAHNVENDKHEPYPGIVKYDIEEHISCFEKDLLTKEEKEREFEKLNNNLSKQVKILKSKLLPVLLAEKRASFLYDQTEGVIDDSRIFRIPSGENKIYKRRVSGKKLNTAISLLCDSSGSMGWGSGSDPKSKMFRMKQTLLVVSESLHALKIPFEIISFTTESPTESADAIKIYNGKSSRSLPNHQYYNRFVPLRHIIFKTFRENYLNMKKEITRMTYCHSNVDNESVKFALKRLAEQREQRKILFVFSDGMPACGYSDTELLEKDLIETVKKGERAGIEIIGIGIQTSAPKNFYTNYEIIYSTEEIAPKIYSSLMKRLKN